MADSGTNDPDPLSPDVGEAQTWLGRLRAGLRRRGPSMRASLADTLDDPAQEQDSFSPEERAMLRNILGLKERRLNDIMVQRADIEAVGETISLGELLAVFRDAGHSRLPVYRGTLDDPVGMVHLKDLVGHLLAGLSAPAGEADPGLRPSAVQVLAATDFTRPLASADIVRPVLFVPPSMPAVDLLAKMQTTHNHMAIVIDEYGGTDGLLTIEDLVEQVVGEIEDEHDVDETPIVAARPGGGFVADGRATLEQVSAAVGVDLEMGEAAEEVDTLSGLIVTLAGRVPFSGERVAGVEGLEFEILDADPSRVKRVGIVRTDTGEPAGHPAPRPVDALLEDTPSGEALVRDLRSAG